VIPLIKPAPRTRRAVTFGVLPQTVPPATPVKTVAVLGHVPMSVPPDPSNAPEPTGINLVLKEVPVVMSGVQPLTAIVATPARMAAA
jgi:hypothetical protein